MNQKGIFSLALAISFFWPFVFVDIADDRIDLEGQPSQSIEKSSERRGEVEAVTFEVTNRGANTIALQLAAQSCACVRIKVAQAEALPGETVAIVASGRVPPSGSSKHSFNVLVVEEGSMNRAKKERMLLFHFALSSEQSTPLEIHPLELSYPGHAWASGVSPVMTVRLKGVVPSADPKVTLPNVGNLDVERISSWESNGQGIVSCIFRVRMPPMRLDLPLTCEVSLQTEVGVTVRANIPMVNRG